MRILITNDDGINAPGLKILEEIAHELAGENGDVWVVAPASEQSGVAHCISFNQPFAVHQHGSKRFSIEGSPADCVIAALYDIMPQKPDFLLSGINFGNNAGENAAYSGTLGAAMEGALHGIRSIALSQFIGPENNRLDNIFETTQQNGTQTIKQLIEANHWEETADYPIFYNVNFPPCSAKDTKPARVGSQARRQNSSFGIQRTQSPFGKDYLWITGTQQSQDTGIENDVGLNYHNHISITPMRADFTAHDAIETMKRKFKSS